MHNDLDAAIGRHGSLRFSTEKPCALPVAQGSRAPGSAVGWKWLFLLQSAGFAADVEDRCEVDTHTRSAKMARLEAVLFIADSAVSSKRLAQWATLANAAEARTLIDQLNESYDLDGSAFRIERVATGYQLLTRPEFAFWLDKLHRRQSQWKLSPPAMETLAIVAYRQPVTRADIETVRGVQCAEMLKQLMERGLVRIVGEDDSLGRPYLYGTTRQFLELFGLNNLDDLPMADRMRPRSETNRDVAAGGPVEAETVEAETSAREAGNAADDLESAA